VYKRQPSKYLQPAAVAAVVKTVVDLGTSGVVPSVRVTP
jgi:hypothetical protein